MYEEELTKEIGIHQLHHCNEFRPLGSHEGPSQMEFVFFFVREVF